MAIMRIFRNGGHRHLGFLKLQISNCGTCQECRIASLCQISWRSVEVSQGCRGVTISRFFKMAAAAILDFLTYKFLTVQTVHKVELRHCAKFSRNHSNCSPDGDFSIFYFSRWRPPPSWVFKSSNFNGRRGQEGWTAASRQIWSKSLEPRPRYGHFGFFQDGGRPLSWICDSCVWTTHEGHLVVFITVQNLVRRIRCSSFDNMHVFRFREFGLKAPIRAPQFGVLGFCVCTWPTHPTNHAYATPFCCDCSSIIDSAVAVLEYMSHFGVDDKDSDLATQYIVVFD